MPMSPPCQLCGSTDWADLPVPTPTHSVRSDGAIIPSPLAKVHCRTCGLGRARTPTVQPDLTAAYETTYDMYANRPRAEEFDASRYTAMAEAVDTMLGEVTPRRVLEIGCGNGSMLAALARRWPTATLAGVEPAGSAADEARRRGFDVIGGTAGGDSIARLGDDFDLVVSFNVIEHTAEPDAFVAAAVAHLAADGHLLLACPDGGTPWMELMLEDHRFSFTRAHLRTLVRTAGLVPGPHMRCPTERDRDNVQMLLAAAPGNAAASTAADDGDGADPSTLLALRTDYLGRWATLDRTLAEATPDSGSLFVFGTGGWAALLAAHAPSTWARASACVVDGGSDSMFHGKAIHDYCRLATLAPPDGRTAVVTAVNPVVQPVVAERLHADGYIPIVWSHRIPA